MRIRKIFSLLDKSYLLLLALFFLPTQQSASAYNLGPDDVLSISVYGDTNLKTETRVSEDGRIIFPLIGSIEVGGKSSLELEEAIATGLIKGGFVHEAQVNVMVLEHVSQQISVLGYVKNPGRYPLNSNSTIIDSIAMAGGIQEMGGSKVVVTRTVNGGTQKQELNLQEYLEKAQSVVPFKMQQGDVVYVPKADMFYIYGEVLKPGEYRITPTISVVKALSMGGGLTLRGTENGIIIKRKDAKGDLLEIDTKLNDAVLEGDVIYVGERWF
jgi:polysaccharide export outer membrane protein